MPPANTRAALSAAAPASASAMASLTAKIGTKQIASRRTAVTSSSSFPSPSFSSSSASSFSSTATSSSPRARQQTASLPALSAARRPLPISACTSSSSLQPASAPSGTAAFSTTPSYAAARENQARDKRNSMKDWLRTIARNLFVKKPDEEVPEMIEKQREGVRNRPFPHNPTFRAQSILGESLRESIWHRVRVQGQSIKSVAAASNIDMRRVAAVVRLKEVEKKWAAEGKFMAKPYHDAVHDMIRTHDLYHDRMGQAYENVNEIHTHAYTKQQLFVPASESRQFTREDAARAFHPRMLSPDKRVPIPELIQVEKDILGGEVTYEESMAKLHEKATAQQEALAKADREAAAAEEESTKRIDTERFEFRIRDINADNVGADGRSPHAVGWRYGVPFDDRKPGQVKIPTSVG